jgi:uncharacterized membrane protein YeaQ/YmgE (transglycosylase-associated protein family)
MDIGKSFSFPFQDERWLSKSLIGAIVAAVPIVNFAWLGYLVDLVRNVMAGSTTPLPEWGDFGNKWVRGLLLTFASMIYAIPAIILACIPLTMLGGFSATQSGDLTDQAAGSFAGVGGIFACLIAVYSLFLTFILPAIYINYARNSTFAALFEFSRIFAIIRDELSKYATAWVVSLLAGIVVGLVVGLVTGLVGWIPCVGWVLAILIGAVGSVYTFYIYGHLFGQVGAAQGKPLSPSNQITL